MPTKRWLEFASRVFNSIELNGTFYSLKSPAVFRRWASEVPARNFVFALKGGRFITHNLKLTRSENALGNFFASGVLALGKLTGPFLWQLPATYSFEYAEEVTADFVYVRLHGSRQLYVSGYTDDEIDEWAERVVRWTAPGSGRDVYVYFDNDAKVHAPDDAIRLAERAAELGVLVPRPEASEMPITVEKHRGR